MINGLISIFQILSPHDVKIQQSILENLAPQGKPEVVFNDDLSAFGDLLADPMRETCDQYYSYIEGTVDCV